MDVLCVEDLDDTLGDRLLPVVLSVPGFTEPLGRSVDQLCDDIFANGVLSGAVGISNATD